ncbi:MAG: glycine cleavage system protein GcvH [Lachnospiraceae bacterium]|nr:glycine cleavage system protein GcvH [Lachnospiraceae bacterium]
MNFPEELKYTKTHEWVRFEDETTAYVGITDYAQNQLGDLVFANLPEAGDDVVAGDPFADVESVKAVSDVISPVTGVVEEVNEDLTDDPAMMNEAPYEAWFVKVRDITDTDELMSADEYNAYVNSL